MKTHFTLFITAFFLTLLAFTLPVYAGGINGNEAAIVSIIQGQFEKDGVIYRVDSSYVSSATAYLSQEDVDLTSAQCQEVINEIYSNIQTGVESGYLVLVGNTETQPNESPSISDESNNHTSESTTGEAGESTQLGEGIMATVESSSELMPETTSPIISILELVPTTNSFEYDEVYRETDLLMQSAAIPKQMIIMLVAIFGGIVGFSGLISLKAQLFIHHKRKSHRHNKNKSTDDWEDD